MSEVYAAKIDNGIVTHVIVGTAGWAVENIGGQWVDTSTLVGIGWAWDETNGFQEPIVEEPVE